MQVDDKLAKEKLARMVEMNTTWMRSNDELAQLLRNADLTDCQQHRAAATREQRLGSDAVGNPHSDAKDGSIPSGPAKPQKEKAMNEHSSGTRAEVPPSATDSGAELTDLQMTALCASAMGIATSSKSQLARIAAQYNPLEDDAQAMALVKKFRLSVGPDDGDSVEWAVWDNEDSKVQQMYGPDLNRAIVECVAKMQIDGTAPETSTVARHDEQKPVAAPDQGSVRNATDKLTRALAVAILWALDAEGGYTDLTKELYEWATAVKDRLIPGNPMMKDILTAAIRALPVLEDQKD